MSKTLQNVREAAKSARFLIIILVAATIAACDGTEVPPEFTNQGQEGFELADDGPMMVELTGFVGGDPGDGSVNALSVFGSQTSRATTVDGELLPGANGVELKDMGWVNLYNSGLSSTPLPEANVRFFAEGGEQPLTQLPTLDASGIFNHDFDAQALRTGSRLILEMEVRGEVSRLQLPLLNLHDGDRLGFNAFRRADGTLVAELFIDAINNATQEPTPDGRSDNGIRLVVDNGTDLDGDGIADPACRMDTADGLSFFDLNLDGLFGDPDLDAMTFLDSSGDGFANLAFVLGSEEERANRLNELAISYLYDPELDGEREDGAERDLGDATEADLIESIEAQLTPASVSANGLDTSTLGVVVRPSAAGIPLDASIDFRLMRQGGNLAGSLNDVRWVSGDSRQSGRVLTPSDPEVRLLSDGSFVLNESLIAPLLETDSLSPSTRVEIELEVPERNSAEPILQHFTLGLTRSTAPKLSQVNFLGQVDISAQSGDLETLSRRARLVWGDPVQVIGENFANVAEGNVVAINGVPATDVVVNAEGTQLDFTIPEGATSGPLTVVVNGLGGRTSKDLIVAGMDFDVAMISPAPDPQDAVQIPANAYFSIAMTRQVEESTAITANAFLREEGTANVLDWAVDVIREGKTIHITNPGGALEAGKIYELVVTSGIHARGTDPALHFDALPNVPLGSQVEERVIGRYEALGLDSVGAEVRNADPADGATLVATNQHIVLEFNEPLDVSSIEAGVMNEEITLTNLVSGEAEAIDWTLSADLRTLTFWSVERMKGGSEYQLLLTGHAIHDRAANGLAAGDYTLNFTTQLDVEDLSPRSGPPGTVLRITGGNFGEDPLAVTVRIGSQELEDVVFFSERRIDVTLPEDITSGLVQVETAGEMATSRVPFTVTLPLRTEDLPSMASSRPIGVAVSGDDSRVFISNQGNGTIGVFDLNALTPVDADNNPMNGTNTPINVGSVPSEVVFSRDAKLLLSLDYGTPNAPGDSFFVIDAEDAIGEPQGERYGLAATVAIGKRPTRIAGSPDGWRWYVTNFLDDTLSVITAESPFQVAATIPTGNGPNGVGISPDGTTGCICNYLDGTVTIFDPLSFTTLGEVGVGLAPARALVSADGKYVFVTCFGDNTIHIIDVENKVNAGNVPVNRAPAAMTLSRDGSTLYVCSREQDTVSIFDVVQPDLESEPDADPISLVHMGDIATGRVPSGIAVTTDGSRLIVSNEEAGHASVIYLQQPRHKIVNMVRGDGEPARSWDIGGTFCVRGTGFDPDPLNNTVLFNGVPAEIDPEASTPNCLVITIPEGASSGAVTVLVGGEKSNGIDCIVHPDAPKVVRTTPHFGARNVDRNNPLVIRFNEPIQADEDSLVLHSLLDSYTFAPGQPPMRDQGDVIAGSFQLRDFDKELVFYPDQPLPLRANSNNIFRLTIKRSVRDLVGTPMQRSVPVMFRLTDTRGPMLFGALLTDVDHNGVDQGDILELVFDEPLALPEALADTLVPNNFIDFNDASTLGTDARFIALSPEFFEEAGLRPYAFATTLGIELGEGADLTIPGLRTLVEGIRNLSGDLAIADLSGNTDLHLAQATGIDMDSRLQPDDLGTAMGAVLLENNNDGIGQQTERLRIFISEVMTDVSAIDPASISLVGSGSLGTGYSIERLSGTAFDDRVFDIVLGAGANFDIAGGDRIESAGPINALRSWDDQPLTPIDPTRMNFRVGLPTQGPRITLNPAGAVYRDVALPVGVSAGDLVLVSMNEPVRVGRSLASDVFTLSAQGDSFGRGAYIRRVIDPLLVEIVLGANPKLRPNFSQFDPAQTGFGAASGIEVKQGVSAGALSNVFGLAATPDEVNGPYGIASDDQDAPFIRLAKLIDVDDNGVSSAGDELHVVFSEPVLRAGASLADFSVMRAGNGFDFGAGAFLARGSRTSLDGDTFVITLGDAPSLPMEPNVELGVSASNPISDASGNSVDPNSSVILTIIVGGTPKLLSATFFDVNGDGVNAGDMILARFNQSVLLGSNNPADAFALPNATDAFGSMASMDHAQVTAEMIALGLSKQTEGTTDPKLIAISLGMSASLKSISGIFPGLTANFTGSNASTSSGEIPVGLMMRPAKGVAFSQTQLASLLSNPLGVGSPLRFDDLAFDADGNGMPEFTFSVGLPNTESSAQLSFGGSKKHFEAVVGALNAAFISNGFRSRVFYNAAGSEIVIRTNGQPNLTPDAAFLPSGDYLGGVLMGVAIAGVTDALTNVAGTVPSGQADLEVLGDDQAPSLVSASFDETTNLLELTFSEPVERGSILPSLLFELGVEEDRFGTRAAYAPSPAANVIRLQLPQLGRNLTINGVFDPLQREAGSPSGIAIRRIATAGSLSDFANNASVRESFVDIEGGSVMALTDVTFSLVQGQPAQHELTDSRMIAAVLSITPPSQEIGLESAQLHVQVDAEDANASPMNASRAVGQVLLVAVLNSNGEFDGLDTPLYTGVLQQDGSLSFDITDRITSTVQVLVMFEMVPERQAIGASFSLTVVGADGELEGGETISALGLPLNAGSTTIVDDRVLTGNSLVLQSDRVSSDQDIGAGRKGHAAVNLAVVEEQPVMLHIPASVLGSHFDASASGSATDLEGLAIDLEGFGSPTIFLNTTAGVFSGGIDTPQERAAFLTALQTELNAVTSASLIAVFDADDDLAIVQVAGDLMRADGLGGGFLPGGDCPQPIYASFLEIGDGSKQADVTVVFGGEDQAGAYHNDLSIFQPDIKGLKKLNGITISGDPRFGNEKGVALDNGEAFPAPRAGHVMTSDGRGGALLYGGRDQQDVFDDVWWLFPIYAEDPVEADSEPVHFIWRRLADSSSAGVHGAAGAYVAASSSVVDGLVIVGGALSLDGSNLSDQVRSFSVGSQSWRTLAASSASISERWGHSAGFDRDSGRLIVYGGRGGPDPVDTLTDLQELDLNASSTSYELTELVAAQDSGEVWSYGFGTSMVYLSDSSSAIILGGVDDSGQIGHAGSQVFLTSGGDAHWSAYRTSRLHGNTHFERAHAAAALGNGVISYFYGEDSQGLRNDFMQIQEIGGFATTRGLPNALGAIYLPKPSASGGTAGSDMGERIVVVFPQGTNMADYGNSFTATQMGEWLQLSVAGAPVTLPGGSTGEIASMLEPDDTLVITLGSGIAGFASGEVMLDFSPNAQSSFPLGPNYGGSYSGEIPVMGSADASQVYIWQGATSSDYYDPSNWLVDGEVATSIPGSTNSGEIALVSSVLELSGTPSCFVRSDAGGMLPELHQLLVLGGSFHSNGGLRLKDDGTNPPVLWQVHGEISFGQPGSLGALEFSNSLFDRCTLWVYGANVFQDVTAADTNFSSHMNGELHLRGDFTSGGQHSAAAHTSFGASLHFSGEGASLDVHSGELGRLKLDLSNPMGQPGTLSYSASSVGMKFDSVEIKRGVLDMGGEKLKVGASLRVDPDGSFAFTPSAQLHFEGFDLSAQFEGHSLPSLRFSRSLISQIDNGGFGNGFSNWNQSGSFSIDNSNALTQFATDSSARYQGGAPFAEELSQTLKSYDIPQGTDAFAIALYHANSLLSGFASIQVDVLYENFPIASRFVDLNSQPVYQWSQLVVPVEVPEDATNFDQFELVISFQADSSSDFIWLDSVDVVSVVNTRGAFSVSDGVQISDAYMNLHVGENERIELADIALQQECLLSFDGRGEVEVTGSLSTNQQQFIELNGEAGSGSTPTLALILNGTGDWTLNGGLQASFARLQAINGASTIKVSNDAQLHASRSSFENIAIEVEGSDTKRVASLALDTVDFSGTPPASSESGRPAYIVVLESNFVQPQALYNIYISNPSFASGAPMLVPVEALTPQSTPASEVFLFGFDGSAGNLGPSAELDPSGSAGMEASTGLVRWDADAGTLAWQSGYEEDGYAMPAATDVVLASLELEPELAGVSVSEVIFQLVSTLDESITGQHLNLSLYMESGGGMGYQAGTDMLLESYGATSVDDEKLSIGLSSPLAVNGAVTLYLVADLGASAPVGGFVEVYLDRIVPEMTAAGLTGNVRARTGSLLGRTIIGDDSTPVILALEHFEVDEISPPFTGDQVVIKGRNLGDAQITMITDGSVGSSFDFSSQYALDSGEQIMNVHFAFGGSGSPDRVLITIDPDGTGPMGASTLTFQPVWGLPFGQ